MRPPPHVLPRGSVSASANYHPDKINHFYGQLTGAPGGVGREKRPELIRGGTPRRNNPAFEKPL